MQTRADFASAFSLRPGLNWIHVVSSDGSSTGEGTSTSDGVTNYEDREFLFAMRAQCDAIFVSAKTAAAENYRASKYAPIYVIDRSHSPDSNALATDPTADKHGVYVVSSIEEALNSLPGGNQSRILLESGRQMTAAIIADASAAVEVTQALVTVITSDANLAAGIARDLLDQLGAQAVATAQLTAKNVYLAFAVGPAH
jgi:riboflavin biosynthesis pyrimidine reductase